MTMSSTCRVSGKDHKWDESALLLAEMGPEAIAKGQIAATLGTAFHLERCANALERIADLLEVDDIKKQYEEKPTEKETDG